MKIDKKELHSIFTRIRDDDEAEFNKLYEKYKTLVYGVAFSILKNKEDSEEIVQSVFMKIFKLEKEKLPKENEASWLYAFSKNASLNFLRTKKENLNIDEVYYITDADDELNDIIEKDTYNRIISKLNEKEQEIVSLKILSNLSFKEISRLLDIPIGTVQWRYYKSLHTLKVLLSSLSMYILTIIIFITQKGRLKNEKEGERQEIGEKEDINQEEVQEGEKTEDDEQKRQEAVTSKDETNTSKTEMNNINTNIENNNISTNTEEKNNIGTKIEEYTVAEQKYNEKLNLIDIGLLSVSSIFLIITIIFLVFFIKNQQKAKRKVSK